MTFDRALRADFCFDIAWKEFLESPYPIALAPLS